MERYEFNCEKVLQDFNDSALTYAYKIQAEIVKKEDDAIKQALIRYMRERAEEYDEAIELTIMDDKEAEKIIELGIDAYLKTCDRIFKEVKK